MAFWSSTCLPEESATLRNAAAERKLSMIPLVAPTTGHDREPRVLSGASGFVYYVSVTGVTGAKAPLADAARDAAALRERAACPSSSASAFALRKTRAPS